MFAGNLLLLLVALTLRFRARPGEHELGRGVLLGFVAGLTFVVRYQTGFALAGYGVWLLAYDRRWRLLLGMVPGVCAALAVGMAADWWLYGEWTLVPLNYLRKNIFHSQMDKFGISPWWYYFTESLREGGYLGGALVLAAIVWFFVRHPRHVVTWMLVPFLAVHFFLGHKELRFFFPALFFAPYFLTLFFDAVPRRWFAPRGLKWIIGMLAAANLGACVYGLVTSPEREAFYRMMWEYCRDKGRVVALGRDKYAGGSLYAYRELVDRCGLVETRFYMPPNLTLRLEDTRDELERAVRELTASGTRVVILSPNPRLAETDPLPLRKLTWSPYPEWVRRYFNFNDWTRFAVRYLNVYEVELPDGEPLPDAGTCG